MGLEKIKSPLCVQADITTRCYLSCKYCYFKYEKNNVDIDTNRFIEVIEELNNLEVFLLLIAGGEPFLHPDIWNILEFSLRTKMAITVLTSGTVDDSIVDEIKRLYVNYRSFVLQISLDHPNEIINDGIRGNTRAVKTFINKCIENNIMVHLSSVISKYNIYKLHEIVQEYYPMIKCFQFINLMTPEGKKVDELIPSDKELDESYVLLTDKIKKWGYNDMIFSHPQKEQNLSTCVTTTAHGKGCTAGYTSIGIDPYLNVYPCCMKPSLIIGNLKKESFATLWNSERIEKLRLFEIPYCKVIGNITI